MNRLVVGGAAGWTAVVVAAAFLAPRPAVDNSIDALLASDAPAVDSYRRFLKRFGSDEVVVARVEGPDALAVFRAVETVTATLTADPSMRGVLSVTSLHPEMTTVILDEVFGGSETLADSTDDLRSPIVRQLGLWAPGSSDGTTLDGTTTANVYGLATISAPAIRANLERRLSLIRTASTQDGIRLLIAGPPLLNLALDRAGRQTEGYALPLLLVVSVILLLILTGRLQATVALFGPVGLAVLATDGAYGLFGGVTNLLVNVAKPLLLVIGLASAVHVYFEFRHLLARGVPPLVAPWVAARRKGLPVMMALLTTAVGFGSLALSTVAPIRAFGQVAGIGLLGMIPTVLLSVPLVLRLFAPRSAVAREDPKTGAHPEPQPSSPGLESRVATLAEKLVRGSLARPGVGPVVGVVLVIAGALALPALQPEPHAIRYFPSDHPLRRDHVALERAGLGLATIEVIISAPGIGSDPTAVAALRTVAQSAAEHPTVAAVVGYPHLVDEALVATNRKTVDDWVLEQLKRRPSAAAFAREDHVRLALLVRTITADDIERLKHHVAQIAQRSLPSEYKVEMTGNYDLLLNAQAALLQTLRTSLFWTAVLMELALLVVLRSFWLAIIAIVPNLVPVAVNLLAMVALGIPLDLGTSMTAAIALGIAVDDTLHFVLAAHRTPLEVAARSAGSAIVVSSLVIGIGFAALLTATFLPTQRFGGLCALAMLSALFADLCVLPPLLRWYRGPQPY